MANYLNSTIEDVKFHIETQDFDGPIDLLVKFVKEAKIDVMEIFVSDITTQYVNYVQSLKELNYEYVCQYIIFAALLIEIKSSKMTPPPVYYDEDDSYSDYSDDYVSAESIIIEEVRKKLLVEYPEKLKPREVVNVFYPEPQYDEKDYKLIAKNLTLDKLLDAYKLLLEKIEYHSTDNVPKTITKEKFTVADKVKELAAALRTEKTLNFFSLFDNTFTKIEIINVFLAILELVKIQIALARQDETGDIILEHNPNDEMLMAKEEEILENVEEYD